ncbi:MAG: adenosine kinase [Rhodospirillales bacterium]
MSERSYDVCGIGNAIVDVLASAKETFLSEQGLTKGAMSLIDGARAEALYQMMGPAREISGGSAANSMVGIQALGGSAAFIGKVRNDQLGGIFAHDIRAAGVDFPTLPAQDGPPTARCLIVVTPDGQRTMNTYLGACVGLGPAEVDAATVQAAKVTYLEGYLFDPPEAKQAFLKAAELAHDAGRKVALTLSDPFCVERHRDDFRNLIEGHVDLLFANEAEAMSLAETDDLGSALSALEGKMDLAVVTRSAKGAILLSADGREEVEAFPVQRVVDTTGAGDLFAAGFLAGYTKGKALKDCGRSGALAASEIISHFGARPEIDLADFARQHLS